MWTFMNKENKALALFKQQKQFKNQYVFMKYSNITSTLVFQQKNILTKNVHPGFCVIYIITCQEHNVTDEGKLCNHPAQASYLPCCLQRAGL